MTDPFASYRVESLDLGGITFYFSTSGTGKGRDPILYESRPMAEAEVRERNARGLRNRQGIQEAR